MPKADLSSFILASDRVVMFSTYFKLESTSKYYISQGLEHLSTMWSSVTEAYNKLTKIYAKMGSEDPEAAEDREAMNKKYFECFEVFCTFSGRLQERLEAVSTEAHEPTPIEVTSNSTNVSLPPCDIEPFKGDFISWPTFRDLFSAVYVKNSRLAPIEKLYHLLHKTKGDAHDIVKRAPLTNEGFALAWANLSKAYDNKRVLTNLQLDIFFHLKSVTSEYSPDLKILINGINSVLDCLELLDLSVKDWDPIVVYHCCRRLPDATLSLWEQTLENKTELPTWSSLNAFLNTRCLALDSIASTRKATQGNTHQKTHSKPFKSHTTNVALSKKENDNKCSVCYATYHRLWLCDKFKSMQPSQRLNFAKTHQLCLNCLSHGHRLDSCGSQNRCASCNRKHHTLLHLRPINSELDGAPGSTSGSAAAPSGSHSNNFGSGGVSSTQPTSAIINRTWVSHFTSNETSPSGTTISSSPILGTATILIEHAGVTYPARALIDPASEVSFIAHSLVKRAQLPWKRANVQVSGVAGHTSSASSKMCNFQIRSPVDPSVELACEAYVLPKITSNLPSCSVDLSQASALPVRPLADSSFHISAPIDILLGSDLYPHLLLSGVKHNLLGSLVGQETIFGWVLTGNLPGSHVQSMTTTIRSFHNLEQQLKAFWEIEEAPTRKHMSPADQFCENLYRSTTFRNADGRFVVSLPFKENHLPLAPSRAVVLAQFQRNEARLLRNPEFHNSYSAVIKEYLTLNHMHMVSGPAPDKASSAMCYYLPHHPVIKPESTTTSLRVVFNASFKTASNASLNDVLHQGPALQADLTFLLIRWRLCRALDANLKSAQEELDADRLEATRPDNVPFFKLFRYSSTKDRIMYGIGILAAIGCGLTTPANTLIVGNLTQVFVTLSEGDVDSFLSQIGELSIYNCIIGAVMLICSYISITLFNYAAQNQVLAIRGKFFLSVMHQDMAWFDFNQSGEVASRMNEDLSKLEEGLGEKVAMFIQYMTAFVGSIVLAFVKGWQLALVCLVSLPVTMISLGLVAAMTSRLSKKELKVYAEAGNVAEQAISGVRTVKAFEGEQKEVSFYQRLTIEARKICIKRQFFSGLGFGVLWFCIYSSYALSFWYGVGLVLENYAGNTYYANYDPGTMITVFFAVLMGSMNIGISSPYIEAFGIAKGAAGKVFRVIRQVPTINPIEPKGNTLNDPIRSIEFINVGFVYPTRKQVTILENFNLKIERGETVAFVGSSGSGKSTCIQLIQRFYDPVEGRLLVNGVDLKDWNASSVRKRIGVVGQEPMLFGTTIYENIRYGKEDATREEIEAAAKAANAHNFINKLPKGYETLVGERGSQLSGGQKQRISIARALVRDPDVLLLDEATSALDTASEKKVQRALEKASEGRTTIIVAHRLSTIRNAQKIIVLNQGKVVEFGTHESLMERRSYYFNLVKAQVGDEKNDVAENHQKALDQLNEEQDEDDAIAYIPEAEVEVVEEQDQNSYVLQIFKFNKPEWLQLLIGCIASAIAGFSMPLFAIIFGDLIEVLSNRDPVYVRENTNKYSLYFVICGIVVGLASFIQIYAFGIAGEKLTERLRGWLFQTILRQDIAWFDKKENSTGVLCSRLSSDAAAVQGATGQRVGSIVQSVVTLIASIGLSFYYQWSLGLVALAFTPIILVGTFLQQRAMAQGNMGMVKALEDCTKLAVEAVSNIRTVVSLCRERLFYIQYMELLTPALNKTKVNNHYRGVIYGLARSVTYFAYAACMYYGATLVVNNGTSIGSVFKVTQALIMGTSTVGNILAFTPNLQKGVQSAANIYKLILRQSSVVERPNAIKTPVDVNGDVFYNAVEFTYPTRQDTKVLRGLDLSVMRGQKIALVGQSGCGKSTCIQLLLRYYDVDGGSVNVDQYDVRDLSFANLYKQLGVVQQEPILFNRTIAENIAYGDNKRLVTEQEIISAAKKANIHNFIASLPMGYETSLGEKGTQLSGGQKQRVAIARVLIRNPKVILLDEATSALDTTSEKVVQESLDVASEGRTTISIAHRLSTVVNCDRIFVIEKGVVAEQGTHKELLEKRGIYNQLYRLQNPGS